MSDLILNAQVIKFSVILTGFLLAQPERETLDILIQKYIRTLLEDLSIPAKFTLSIKWSEAKDQTHPSYKILIHGKKCSIPLTSAVSGDIDGKTLASQITEIIHLNRALLINPAISRFIRKTYLSGTHSGLQNLSSSELHKLITKMVKRGFSLHRWTDFMPNMDTTGWHHLQFLEAVIQVVESTQIRVWYNKTYHQLNTQSPTETLSDLFLLMQDGLFYELGLVFPQIQWELDESFADNEFCIQINDVTYPAAFGLNPGEVLVNDTRERLLLLNIEGKPATNPANGLECTIVDEVAAGVCEAAGLTTWSPLGYLILYVSQQLRQHAGSFLTMDVVDNNLNALSAAFPDLVDTILSKYDLLTLTPILRELLDEALSIRDLRSILDNLLLINGTTRVDLNKIVLYPEGTHLIPSDREKISDLDFADFAGYIRETALKQYLSHKYTKGTNSLIVYLLDPEIEERIRAWKEKKISKADHNDIIDAIYREVNPLPPTSQAPVILTTTDVRRPFSKLIEVEFPHLAVLSYQELSPNLNIQPIARISLSDSKK